MNRKGNEGMKTRRRAGSRIALWAASAAMAVAGGATVTGVALGAVSGGHTAAATASTMAAASTHRACAASSIAAKPDVTHWLMGRDVSIIRLTNRSGSACLLQNFPQLAFVHPNGKIANFTIDYGQFGLATRPSNPGSVLVEPGASAFISITGDMIPPNGNKTCVQANSNWRISVGSAGSVSVSKLGDPGCEGTTVVISKFTLKATYLVP